MVKEDFVECKFYSQGWCSMGSCSLCAQTTCTFAEWENSLVNCLCCFGFNILKSP